ncbi:ubiquinol-cytochrome C chaperone family protein [Nitrobacter sp.]|uniref:ubiquinol-cytochrome C chaperone family protein n=1 Tax=Nitrobacter sp. TaxID=29420 RepID=UPI003F651A54
MLWPLSHFRKSRAPSRGTIEAIYGMIVTQAREPFFYQTLRVPDTVDGRFDMILLHLWIALSRLKQGDDKELPQALFDHFCSDMDANLREMGVGDLTVPKRMHAFGEAFYGRSAAYDRALAEGRESLAEALDRNIYNGRDIESARRLADYAVEAIAAPAADHEVTPAGRLRFPDLAHRT